MSQNESNPRRQTPRHATPAHGLPKRVFTRLHAWWALRGMDLLFYVYLVATVGFFYLVTAQLLARHS